MIHRFYGWTGLFGCIFSVNEKMVSKKGRINTFTFLYDKDLQLVLYKYQNNYPYICNEKIELKMNCRNYRTIKVYFDSATIVE